MRALSVSFCMVLFWKFGESGKHGHHYLGCGGFTIHEDTSRGIGSWRENWLGGLWTECVCIVAILEGTNESCDVMGFGNYITLHCDSLGLHMRSVSLSCSAFQVPVSSDYIQGVLLALSTITYNERKCSYENTCLRVWGKILHALLVEIACVNVVHACIG